MSNLRKRLAEVLAMPTDMQAEIYAQRTEMAFLCRDPALARALEDAERVPALESALSAAEAERDALRADLAVWQEISALWPEVAAIAANQSDALRRQNTDLRKANIDSVAWANEAAAELATLNARLADGVELKCNIGFDNEDGWPCLLLSEEDHARLLPLDGKRVIVLEIDNAREGKE